MSALSERKSRIYAVLLLSWVEVQKMELYPKVVVQKFEIVGIPDGGALKPVELLLVGLDPTAHELVLECQPVILDNAFAM